MQQKRVTIFGGSGFIGRYVVELLADQGAIIKVAVRDIEKAKFLKPLGQVGQITPIKIKNLCFKMNSLIKSSFLNLVFILLIQL